MNTRKTNNNIDVFNLKREITKKVILDLLIRMKYQIPTLTFQQKIKLFDLSNATLWRYSCEIENNTELEHELDDFSKEMKRNNEDLASINQNSLENHGCSRSEVADTINTMGHYQEKKSNESQAPIINSIPQNNPAPPRDNITRPKRIFFLRRKR